MEEKDMEQKLDEEAATAADTGGEEHDDTPVTDGPVGEHTEDAAAGGTEGAEDGPGEDQTPEPEDGPETEEASGNGAEADSREDGKTKTGFFGKKKKKDKLEETVEELTDKLKRSMAEFDNFRKRTEKEKSQMYEIGARDVIEKILPVVDNFERGLDALTDEDKAGGVGQGMEMIYKQLATVLEQLDVKPIEAKGQPFDPNFHNAVMHEENEEAGENEVVEELQKGYTYRGNVVRHSMVKVAN